MSDAPHKYFYQTMDANGAPCMMPHPEGEWVERVRYDRAEARIAELEAAVRELVDADDELATDYLHDEMNDARLLLGREIKEARDDR